MYDYLSASYSICINSKKNMQEDMAGFEEYLKELLTTNKILSDRNIELSCMIQRFKDTGQWEEGDEIMG